MGLRSAIVGASRFVGRAAGEAGKAAVNGATEHAGAEFEGMAARVAERVADNPKVTQAVQRIGAAAAQPVSDAIQPKIIIATVVAIAVILGVVAASRRG